MEVSNFIEFQRKLNDDAREFLMRAYGLDLDIPVKINGRLKSSHGRFTHSGSRKESIKIEISKTYIEHYDWETIYKTLVHECIHYALYELDKPYRDGTPLFESEIIKHNSHSTKTNPYRGKVVEYGCPCCNKTYRKKKRYPRNGVGYVSGCCKKQIVFLGEKIV